MLSPIILRMNQGPGAFTVMARVVWSLPVEVSRWWFKVSTERMWEREGLEEGSVNLRHDAEVTISHGCL